MKARGIPVAYLAFEGEGHGFRRKETIQRTLEAEAFFYARVFGFELADRVRAGRDRGGALNRATRDRGPSVVVTHYRGNESFKRRRPVEDQRSER